MWLLNASGSMVAVPVSDGTYRITGSKIFITYGEHDLTDNIIHFVLARLPDAPPGTKGISLFLVPKFFVNDDGSLGARNDARCHSIEHKLGIHGSPTCTMVYGDNGGATGWLVGEENRGLNCMFTMMNNARLAVGLQGVAIAERATQQAYAYASERKQGRAGAQCVRADHRASGRAAHAAHHAGADPRGARDLLCDRRRDRPRARAAKDDAARKAGDERASLLTPIAKAFSTDIGTEVASLGVQVHGGMGFIEETGAAQHYRDARIAQIYEGTNGIQAIDLVTRKMPMMGGAVVRGYLDELRDNRRGGEGRERSGVRRDRRAAVRSGRQPRPRDGVADRQSSTPRPMRRLPAQRPICGCSRRRRAAACSPRTRSPEAARRRRRQRPRRARALLRREHRRAGGRPGNDRHRGRRFVSMPRCAARLEGRTMTDQVIVIDDGAIRTIRMNRPEKKNALTSVMYDAMADGDRERERDVADPLRADRRRARRVLGRQRSRRFHEGRNRRRGARRRR